MGLSHAAEGIKAQLASALGPLYDPLRDFIFIFIPFVVSGSRFFWTSCVFFVLMADALYIWRARGQKRSLAGFLRFLFPAAIYADPSAKITYKFYFVYRFINVIVPFEAFLGTGQTSTALTRGALNGLFGAGGHLHAPAGPWAMGLFTLFVFVTIDLGYYVSHILMHKVPALWEFHKVHHSVTAMQPVAGSLLHPLEGVLQASWTSLFAGLAIGSAQYLFDNPPAQITVFNASILLILTNLIFLFRHSHVWLAFPYRLSHVLCSPAMHQIHHSTNPAHWDKNLAVNLSVWDWLFGTLYVPRGFEKLTFGLPDQQFADFDSIPKLLLLPFKRSAARLSVTRVTALTKG